MFLMFSRWLITGKGGWARMLCWVTREGGRGRRRPPGREEKLKRRKDLESRNVQCGFDFSCQFSVIWDNWSHMSGCTILHRSPFGCLSLPLFAFPLPLPCLSSHLLFLLSIAFPLLKILSSSLLIFFWPPLFSSLLPFLCSFLLVCPSSGLLSLFFPTYLFSSFFFPSLILFSFSPFPVSPPSLCLYFYQKA